MSQKEPLVKATFSPSPPVRLMRGPGYPLLLVLFVAFTLRMLLFSAMASHPERFSQADSSKYHPTAIRLLQFHALGSFDDTGTWTPNVDRTPGYPAFLAVGYAIFGPLPTAAIIIQILISILTAAVAYRLGKLWVGPRAGMVMAALMSIEVGSILYANQVMTETLFLSAFLGGMTIWSGLVRRRQWRYGFLSGIVLGLTALIRPVLLYFGPVVGLLTLLLHRGAKKERWFATISVLLAFALVLAPWMIRNYVLTGQAQMSTVQATTLLWFNVRQLRAYQQGISIEEAEAQLVEEMQREISDVARQDPVAFARYSQQKALSEIRVNLADYALVHLKGSAIFFVMPTAGTVARALGWVRTGTGLQANLMSRGLLGTLQSFQEFRSQFADVSAGDWLFFGAVGYELLYLSLLNLGAVWGSIRCIRTRRWDVLLLTLTAIGYFALITGPLSYDARYRMPAIPFLALLAALSLHTGKRAIGPHRVDGDRKNRSELTK